MGGHVETDTPAGTEDSAETHAEKDLPLPHAEREVAGGAPDSPIQTLRRVRRIREAEDNSDVEEEAQRDGDAPTESMGDGSRYAPDVAVAGDGANSDEEFGGGDAQDQSGEEEDEDGFPKGAKVHRPLFSQRAHRCAYGQSSFSRCACGVCASQDCEDFSRV
jgi:hypothetical protein